MFLNFKNLSEILVHRKLLTSGDAKDTDYLTAPANFQSLQNT